MCQDDLFPLFPLRTVRMSGPQRRSGGAALGPTASQKPLGAAGRTKRPPQDGTRCPSWDGFRWSQRAARERSESHRGLNWSRHGSWQRPASSPSSSSSSSSSSSPPPWIISIRAHAGSARDYKRVTSWRDTTGRWPGRQG